MLKTEWEHDSRWLKKFEGKGTEKLDFRLTPALLKLFESTARTHGRTAAQELRLLMVMHATRSTIDTLDDPQVQARLGDGAAAFERMLRDDVAELERMLYEIPEPDDLFALEVDDA